MIQANEETLLVGATELRADMPKFIKKLPDQAVVIMKRGKAVAVMQDYEKYKQEQAWLDEFEDIVLGQIAKDRLEHSHEDDFISHEEMLKHFGLS